MSSVSTKSSKSSPSEHDAFAWPFAAYYRSELLWSPLRAASKLMLQAHRNATALAQSNRKLVDEFIAIARHEQDTMNDISEKMLERLSEGNAAGSLAPEALSEFYEAVVSGTREISKAMTEAQTRSMTVLNEHTHTMAEALGRPTSEHKTAA